MIEIIESYFPDITIVLFGVLLYVSISIDGIVDRRKHRKQRIKTLRIRWYYTMGLNETAYIYHHGNRIYRFRR